MAAAPRKDFGKVYLNARGQRRRSAAEYEVALICGFTGDSEEFDPKEETKGEKETIRSENWDGGVWHFMS